MIKVNNTSAEMSSLFYGICILTCSNSSQYMLFELFTVLQQYDYLLNNSRLCFDDNLLTKISLPFIVIADGIVHPLVLLGPYFEDSVILDSISKIKIIITILRDPKLTFGKLRYFGI